MEDLRDSAAKSYHIDRTTVLPPINVTGSQIAIRYLSPAACLNIESISNYGASLIYNRETIFVATVSFVVCLCLECLYLSLPCTNRGAFTAEKTNVWGV